MWGIIFVFGYNAISAILRGMGIQKAFGVRRYCKHNKHYTRYNFCWPLNMNATGAAIATIIAQATAMFLAIIYLKEAGLFLTFITQVFVYIKIN